MALMQQAMDEGKEASIAKSGRHDLRIINADQKVAKSGRPMVVCMIEVLGVDEEGNQYQPVFHNLLFPTPEELAAKFTDGADKEQDKLVSNRKRWALDNRRFLECFNIPYSEEGFDTDDLPGAEGNCLLGLDEYEGVEKNILKLPRLTG